MIPPPRLRDYPFVVVRFACRDCPRLGRYRLAVLAERFGAEAPMVDVLGGDMGVVPAHAREASGPSLPGVAARPA